MYPDERVLVMAGESFHTANMFYATHFLFPDAAIFIDRGGGDTLIVCTDFERDVAAAHSRARRVHGFRDYGGDELRARPDHEFLAGVMLRVLRAEGIARAVTTDDIPLFVADHLRANGVDLACRPDLLKDRRERKDAAELAAIASAQRATERAMQAAVDLIADARAGHDGFLQHGDLPVTSERLRAVIAASLLEGGCTGEGTITASGPDSAQPHNRGSGPIEAGQPIIIDIFPRHDEHRYYSDMTRTISKGSPHHEITRMFELTRGALDLAIEAIRPGVTGRSVFETVCRYYEDHGYATFVRANTMPEAGFIHSLGHGVGLEVHEGPRLGQPDNVLREGEVMTVEPGLYIPGLGGVRLEDIVVVTENGCRNMTDFSIQLAL